MLRCYYYLDEQIGYYYIDVYKDKVFIKNYIFKDIQDMNKVLTSMYCSEYELIYMGSRR